MMGKDGVNHTLTLHLQELIPATVLETTTTLIRVELSDGPLDLDHPELSVLQVVRQPTQRLEVLCSHLVFMNRHSCLVQDSIYFFLLGITHNP
jgi:hypothetical protein